MDETTSAGNSYNDILKSTSIVGGSQAINYVIGMVRTKLVALLLGPTGVGLVGLFQSSIMLVTQLTGLGISSSGVRQIAVAHGSGDSEYTGKTVRVLRRACWATGILGWVVTAVLARPLSVWAFDSPEKAWLIAILGVTLLLTAVSGGQRALIQGTRRISDLAWMTVISSLVSTIAAVAIYAIFGEQGIVPVLIVTAAINLTVSWWFAKRITVPPSGHLSWKETAQEGRQLAGLGFAFMWGGLLAALVDLGVRSLVVREAGLDGAGIYQASWALSGMFANFVLGAMGTDFYPRLTAMADDDELMNATINEQIEIGILIALPGLLGTLALGPFLMTLFYSSEFVLGAILLPWFVLGIFCRVLSWPIGFSILAKGANRWFLVTQTTFFTIQITAVWLLMKPLGLVSAGVGFCIAFLPAIFLNLYIANRLTGFRWSLSVVKIVLCSTSVVAICFAIAMFLPMKWNMTIGVIFAALAGIWSIRGITLRVGRHHRITQTLLKIPGMRLILPS